MALNTSTVPAPAPARETIANEADSIKGETCEKCGPAVTARYKAEKNNFPLFFCGHHIREYHEGLVAKGFRIFPEDVSVTAAV